MDTDRRSRRHSLSSSGWRRAGERRLVCFGLPLPMNLPKIWESQRFFFHSLSHLWLSQIFGASIAGSRAQCAHLFGKFPPPSDGGGGVPSAAPSPSSAPAH